MEKDGELMGRAKPTRKFVVARVRVSMLSKALPGADDAKTPTGR